MAETLFRSDPSHAYQSLCFSIANQKRGMWSTVLGPREEAARIEGGSAGHHPLHQRSVHVLSAFTGLAS